MVLLSGTYPQIQSFIHLKQLNTLHPRFGQLTTLLTSLSLIWQPSNKKGIGWKLSFSSNRKSVSLMPNSPLSHAQPPPHYLMHPPLFTSQLSTYIFCKTSSSFNSFILLTSDCGTLYLHAHIKFMNSISFFKSTLNTQKLALIAILIIIIIIMKNRTIMHSVLLAYIVIILYLNK